METAFLFEVIFITVYLNEWFENTVDQFHAKRDQVAKLPCKARPSGETSIQSATKWRNF